MERGSKVEKPFYWPPQRISLPTPCEIIREARADVLGIRPVPTSRPFTPKQRERVLFGGAKKGTARPPSAVNLTYLQRKDEVGRIKLPTITSAIRTKQKFVTNRTVVSLDNLTEDYEGESAAATAVSRISPEDLPGVRKSHSCPQERSFTTPTELGTGIQPHNAWMVNSRKSPRKTPETAVVRQYSEPLIRKKKVHRLQSLPCNKGQERLEDFDREETPTPDEVQPTVTPEANEDLVTTTSAPPIEISQPTSTEVVLQPAQLSLDTATETVSLEPEPALTMPQEVSEPPCIDAINSEENDSNLVAVLSNGKIVWEPPAEKDKHEHIDENASPGKPNTTHLQNLRNNMRQMSERMTSLQKQAERKTERPVKKDADNGFYMNSKTRYHTTSRNVNNGEKAYKKWMENQKAEEAEVVQEKKPCRPDPAGWDFFWKNSYFRNQEEKLDPSLQYLNDVLEELRTMHSNGDVETAEDKVASLYVTLKSGDFFNQGNLPTSIKSKLLQTVYMFVDSETPRLLLLLARIIFALRVDSGLPAACKMVFKVARSDSNDHLFLDLDDILELFLDGIGRASPLDAAESCIYGYGALKFLTMNSLLLSRAVHLGALDLVTLHLKMVNSSTDDGATIGEQTLHALFQLTGTMRNIAAAEGAVTLFLTTNCIPALCKTLLVFRRDEELVSNISRTLSLLSSEEETTQALLSNADLPLLLLDLMQQYQHHEQILTRLGYTLGNILANSDVVRVQLSRNERTLPILLAVLETYMNKNVEQTTDDNQLMNNENRNKEEEDAIDDVIVKVIRVVANMSMNPVVGSHLSPATQEKNALQLASLLAKLLTRQGPTQLAALGCLNNISYYVPAHSSLSYLTESVMEVLKSSSSHESVIESCRVLGNLTRHKDTRTSIFQHGGMEILQRILDLVDPEVARCVCGVLVNMLLDGETRRKFLQQQGLNRLVGVVEKYEGDWVLAGLVCRGIWNACAQDLGSAVKHNDMDHLLTTLANCLEEDKWKDGDADWEEFAGIATDLLERFNAHLEIHQ